MTDNWTISGGVHLADADDRKLATVADPTPDAHHPGCVQAWLRGATLEDLSQGSGDWRIIDTRTDACYCVQALRLWDASDGLGMLVSSLGESRVVSESDDDDFLILPGQEPVPLRSFLIADGQCCKGLHVRCEFDALELAGLSLAAGRPMLGRGVQQPLHSADQEAAMSGGTWNFVRLRPDLRENAATTEARIVRLRQRSTTRCRFDVVLPETPCGAAVLIGHAVATEHWSNLADAEDPEASI